MVPSVAHLPWAKLAGPLATAEDALARLDERLAKSPIREGWISRTHFADACAALWLEGELVPIEDLVLHDAGRDVRTPTHELTRAHTILRVRRRIAAQSPEWPLSPDGFGALTGREQEDTELDPDGGREGEGARQRDPVSDEESERETATDSELDQAIAAVDAVLSRNRTSEGVERRLTPRQAASGADEKDPFARWRKSLDDTKLLPPTLAAALALQGWEAIEPARHKYLGPLLAAALLRQRGKTRAHLACVHVGLRVIPREKRRSSDSATRVIASLVAITAAAEAGLKDHDRWLAAKTVLERKLQGRRSTSKLPAVIDLVLATPLASSGMIAERLKITPRAAQDLVAELGLREATGRGRYRAWAVL